MFIYLRDYIGGDDYHVVNVCSVNYRCLDVGLCHRENNCQNPLDRHTNLALFDRMGHDCVSAYE